MGKTMLRLLVFLRWFMGLALYLCTVVSSSLVLYALLTNVLDMKQDQLQFWGLVVMCGFLFIGYLVSESSKKIVVRPLYFTIASTIALFCVVTVFDGGNITELLKQQVLVGFVVSGLLLSFLYQKFIYKRVVSSMIFKQTGEIELDELADETDITKIKQYMVDTVEKTLKEQYKNTMKVVGKQFIQDVDGNVLGVFEIFYKNKFLKVLNISVVEVDLTFNRFGKKTKSEY